MGARAAAASARAESRRSTIAAWAPIISPPAISTSAIAHQIEARVPARHAAATYPRHRRMFLARELTMAPAALSMDWSRADPV